MSLHRYLTIACGLLLVGTLAQAEPPAFDAPAVRINDLEMLLQKERTAKRSVVTWDEYGCVPDDPLIDNGPALTRMLTEQGRSIDVAPVGKARDYYVSSTIEWVDRHGGALLGSGGTTLMFGKRGIGVTRIIWTGMPGKPMIRYRSAGGRISQLVIQGARLPTSPRAGTGIRVEGDLTPPTGKLVTDQLTLANLDVGIHCVSEPKRTHADHLTHLALAFHGVSRCYWVDNPQSVPHTIFKVDFHAGFKEAFYFSRGGTLNVYGCYVGAARDSTLLYLEKAGSNAGVFDIQGLQVDATAAGLRLVDHGKYAPRVRISGSIGIAARDKLAKPIVRERDGPSEFADVKIDCTNGVVWPVRAAATPQ